MVGLTGAAVIDCLEVHSALGVPICFSRDHHPTLPLDRRVDRDQLQDTKPHISGESIQYCLLPVEGYSAWGVDSSGAGCGVHMELQRGAALEVGERLVLTDVKHRGSVPVQQELSQFWNILPCGRTWKHWRV